MTPTHALNAVALPAGVHAGGLAISVVLSPRLGGAEVLDEFPDWRHWTAAIADHGLAVQLRLGTSSMTLQADAAALRPDLWEGVFSDGAQVGTYELGDWDERLVVSYPALETAAAVARFYGQHALRPALSELSRVLGPFRFPPDGEALDARRRAVLRADAWRRQQSAGQLRWMRARSSVDGALQLPPGVSAETVVAAVNPSFHLFHSMPPAPGAPPLPATPDERAALLDFHAAVAGLAAHPELQRAVGLVVDLVWPLDAAAPPAAGEVELQVLDVVPGGGWSLAPKLMQPVTACTLQPARFEAAPTTGTAGDVVGGFVTLAGAFGLVPIDVDGAVLGLSAAAESAARGHDEDGGLPTVRSGGVGLVAGQRAAALIERLQQGRRRDDALAPGGAGGAAPALRAIDVQRGQRIDVWSSDTGRWHSLHARSAAYTAGAAGTARLDVPDGEGFTQLAVAQPAADPTRPPDPPGAPAGLKSSDTDLYLHERVARWGGWSLSVARPERALNRSVDPARALDDDETAGQPVTPFKLTIDLAVRDGSLPRLRFGSRYRVRVRGVDLAGNGPGLAADAPEGAVLPAGGGTFPYLRFEPAPHPLVILRDIAAMDLGGALDRLVIRTRNVDDAGDTTVTADLAERHVAPPRGSVELAERHRRLDVSGGSLDGSAATFAQLAERDVGQLPADGPDATPVVSAPAFELPYLPDPLTRDAVLLDLPGVAAGLRADAGAGPLAYAPASGAFPRERSITRVPFSGTWPDLRPFRLVLAEGDGGPAWDEAARELQIALPKAGMVTVALAGGFAPEDLALLGIWWWLEQAAAAEREELLAQPGPGADLGLALNDLAAVMGTSAQAALDGAHRMLSPPVRLTLVHAVQRPLAAPRFDPAVTARRVAGATDAYLGGYLDLHGASTAKVDLEAHWTDPVDDPVAGPPASVDRSGHADELRLDALDDGVPLRAPGETRSTGRYVAARDAIQFSDAHAARHDFGDTRRHRVRYRAIATSRFREYFEPGAEVHRSGPEQLVDVPSSARPAQPVVRYAVPTFGWERSATDAVHASVRRGRGVRVYLERPWWSSGEGELLGVVLWPNGETAPSDDVRERAGAQFTQWGLDPIWATHRPVHAVPTWWDLSARATHIEKLHLPNGRLVDVAGHEVHYAPDRDLWYCDVEFETFETYSPMVRLALARLQPHAVAGLELSAPVVADVLRLAPDRSVTVMRDPLLERASTVTVAGIAPSGPRRSVVSVGVQRRRPGLASDLAWQDASDAADVVAGGIPDDADAILWRGIVTVRTGAPAGDLRLVVREEEQLLGDPALAVLSEGAGDVRQVTALDRAFRAAQVDPERVRAQAPWDLSWRRAVSSAAQDIGAGALRFAPSVVRRLVFAETIELGPAPSPAAGAGEPGEVVPVPGGDVAPLLPLPAPADPPWRPFAEPPDAAGVDLSALPVLGPNPLAAQGLVKNVQALLNASGFVPPLAIDGLLGPVTAAAVAAVQAALGLSATGAVTADVWLGLLPLSALAQLEPGAGDPPMSGPSVALVQDLINRAGREVPLTGNGVFDADMTAAVIRFQRERALEQTGIVDPATWASLQSVPLEVLPGGAWRIVLALETGAVPEVRFVEARSTEEPPPRSDHTAALADVEGWWVEWLDEFGATLFRQVLHDPFGLQPEGPDGAGGHVILAAPAEPAGAEVLVPDLPRARVLVVHGSLESGVPATRLLEISRARMGL